MLKIKIAPFSSTLRLSKKGIHLSIYSFIRSFIHSFIYSFIFHIHSFIHSFIRSFIHSSYIRQVQEYTTQELVDNALKGFNCALFAYGQTSSGKKQCCTNFELLTFHIHTLKIKIDRNKNKVKKTCTALYMNRSIFLSA